MQALNSIRIALLILVPLGLYSGCRSTQNCPPTQCASLAPPALSTPPSEGVAAISSQFSQIEQYASTQLITGDDSLGPSGFLTLENTICIGFQNSAKANLLETQLQRLNQTPVEELEQAECRETLNRAIHAQIIEERNRSASLAAQLFMGLVEVQLQRELLIESQERLARIKNTIDEADEEGFKTAGPKDLLSKQSVLVAEKEAKLHHTDQKIRAQLIALLSLDASTRLEISYDLRPAPHPIDLPTEQAAALGTRAELVELQHMLANWNECTANIGSSFLALADPRLQVELAKLKQIAERSWIWFLLGPEQEERDFCEENSVRQQTQQYFENSRDAVFLAVKLAALDMQNSFEQMVISNDEIQRLKNRVELITASRDIDAAKSYIDLQENWYQTLLARSERISSAVKYESAQIRLAEATGALAQMCGSNLHLETSCNCQ